MNKFGIIGYPLNKPRSVSIWRKYFKKNNIKAQFNPYEIENKNFNNFIKKNFLQDQNFLSMVVTMPYKKKILKYATTIHHTAKFAKSANLLVKKKKLIHAYNTDVLGAQDTLKHHFKNYKNIVIIGLGGTGEAFFNYFYNKYKNKKYILVTSKFNYKSNNVKIINKLDKSILIQKSIIINCTPLGSDLSEEYMNKSPLKELEINLVNPKSLIFDIVYKPKRTKLFALARKFNLKYINGIHMNTVQAKKALELAFDI